MYRYGSGMPEAAATKLVLPDGWVAIVKRDCPTCTLVVPALRRLSAAPSGTLTIYSQDDPAFPEGLAPVDDTELLVSWRLGVETVPTMIRVHDGVERERIVGWSAAQWATFTGVDDIGDGLPAHRPGCGSKTLDPGMPERLAARYDGERLRSRRVELANLEDDIEACYDRGWSDGLPVVPPTPERVLRMLEGTDRAPDEIVAVVPPDYTECSVEKVAINAVMAGCLPEYLPVVLATLAAACNETFNMHGLLCTTMPHAPVIVVNGPIAKAIGMNSGGNVLGQGNRANSTIGRALQLVVRNVGGGKPGGIDRATHGQPGKVGLCFAEDEDGSPWEPLSVSRGVEPGRSAVTLFAGESPRVVVDQLSRGPESLARSFAASLLTVGGAKAVIAFDAMLVVGPEHARVFREAGWTRDRLLTELTELTTRPGSEVVRGAGGIDEGMPQAFADAPSVPKFKPGGLMIVHAGGTAGLFSAIMGSWASGDLGSAPVTRVID